MRFQTGLALGAGVLLLIAGCGSSSNGPAAGMAAPCPLDSRPEATGMPDTDRIFGWIEDLVGIGFRRTGTPEGFAAAAYVKCQFESLGLEDVHYETATSWNWQVQDARLLMNGEAVDSFPSAHSFVTPGEPSRFSTGPDGLTAEMVDIGGGSALDFALNDVEGKIVVFDLKFQFPPLGFAPFIEFLWDPLLTIVEPELFQGNPFITNYGSVLEKAVEAGAVGFIGVLVDYFESNRYYNEFHRRSEISIPGFWVSPGEGERMRARLAATSTPSEATIHMHGSREHAEARTVVGYLHGRSRDTIMVQSHHDSVFYGAVEDGSGTAAVLAQAQYFASQPPESREKTLIFITFDSHYTGYQAHQDFVRKYITERETPYNIVANVTLEHIARQAIIGDDGQLEVTDRPELRAIIENLGPTLKLQMINSVIRHDLRRTAILQGHLLCPLGAMPTDASFVCTAGVPTASLISGPIYLYDEADTLDKVAREDLVPVTHAFIELIEAIDRTPPLLIGVPIVGDLLTGLGDLLLRSGDDSAE
jgi:hypothetical protein